MDEHVIYTTKPTIYKTQSGYRLSTSIPKEIAQVLFNKDTVVVFVISKKELLDIIVSQKQNMQEISNNQEILESAIHKILAHKLQKFLREALE